jgi:hypothetical protein
MKQVIYNLNSAIDKLKQHSFILDEFNDIVDGEVENQIKESKLTYTHSFYYKGKKYRNLDAVLLLDKNTMSFSLISKLSCLVQCCGIYDGSDSFSIRKLKKIINRKIYYSK